MDITTSAPETQSTLDSTALQSLSSTIHEPQVKPSKVDLAAIREAYDDDLLNTCLWCPDPKLLEDLLTKDNPKTVTLLLEALYTGLHTRPTEITINLGHN